MINIIQPQKVQKKEFYRRIPISVFQIANNLAFDKLELVLWRLYDESKLSYQ